MQTRRPPRTPFIVLLLITASTATLTSTYTGTTEPSLSILGLTIPNTFTTITYFLITIGFLSSFEESYNINTGPLLNPGLGTMILHNPLTLFPAFHVYMRFTTTAEHLIWLTTTQLVLGLLYLTLYTAARPHFLRDTTTNLLASLPH